MSFVYPSSLAATTANLALSRGALRFGMVFLAAAFVTLFLVQVDRGTYAGWPALLAIVAIAGAGAALARPSGDRPGAIAAAAALALAGSTLFALVLIPRLSADGASDSILLSMVKIAVISFGAVIGRRRSGTLGVLAAVVIAEAPVLAVSLWLGRAVSLDVPATGIAVALLAVLSLFSVSRRRSRASAPLMTLAGEEDRRAVEAARAEHSSSAMVHDTILNELAVVATLAPGTLSPAARTQIARSLELVTVAGSDAAALVVSAALEGEVAAAVQWARTRGLEVTVDGDTAAVDRLPAETSAALGRAVLQCLTNVIAHAGVASAELTVIATEDELCVMVIDSGVGFTESETGADRMGLRNSVRGRIADAGGTVQVWSAPGAGTAVSMLVPR